MSIICKLVEACIIPIITYGTESRITAQKIKPQNTDNEQYHNNNYPSTTINTKLCNKNRDTHPLYPNINRNKSN